MLGRALGAALVALALSGLAGLPDGAWAEPDEAPPDASRDALPPSVGLDRLLRLPDSYRSDSTRRGGATRTEWKQRFAEAEAGLVKAQAELEDTQTRLENAADSGGQWAASAPGISSPDATTTTVSYKLRQDLRRLREQVEVAEAELLDLQVRADLASVPADWRE